MILRTQHPHVDAPVGVHRRRSVEAETGSVKPNQACHAARMHEGRWVAAARPKALPMANGQTIGKLVLAAATHNLIFALPRCCHAVDLRESHRTARKIIHNQLSMVNSRSQGRSGGRSAWPRATRGGKSEQGRARWWLTATGGNPRESATENTQPMAPRGSGKGEMVR